MSGAAEAYALFVFPPECPIEDYIQAFPEMTLYLDNAKLVTSLSAGMYSTNFNSDVISFYKEELAGETGNQVHMIVKTRDCSRIKAVKYLAEEGADAHIKATIKVRKKLGESLRKVLLSSTLLYIDIGLLSFFQSYNVVFYLVVNRFP